jgi:hypothetical protein
MLSNRLGLKKYEAVGLLETLWHFTARYAPRGDVGRFTDGIIATSLDWRGNSTELIEALVSEHWLDADDDCRLVVHHWSDHSDDTCDKYLANHGLTYTDGKKPRRKPDKGVKIRKSAEKSGKLRRTPENSRQPVSKSEPKSGSEPVPVPKGGAEPAAPTGMLDQVKRIKAIRKEFSALRDVDIENALKNCPPEFREAGIHDFERDMLGALKIPDIPTKVLGSYMTVAARAGSKPGAGGRPWDDDGATDAEKKADEAYRALARQGK